VVSVSSSARGPARQLPSRGDTARASDVADVLALSSGGAAAGVEPSDPQPTNSIEVAATATAAARHLTWVAPASAYSVIVMFDTTRGAARCVSRPGLRASADS
jgi:hypothetical protein